MDDGTVLDSVICCNATIKFRILKTILYNIVVNGRNPPALDDYLLKKPNNIVQSVSKIEFSVCIFAMQTFHKLEALIFLCKMYNSNLVRFVYLKTFRFYKVKFSYLIFEIFEKVWEKNRNPE